MGSTMTQETALFKEIELLAKTGPEYVRDNIGQVWLSAKVGKIKSRDQIIGGSKLQEKTCIRRLFSDISEKSCVEGVRADYVPTSESDVAEILPTLLETLTESDAIKLQDYMRGEALHPAGKGTPQNSYHVSKLMKAVHEALKNIMDDN